MINLQLSHDSRSWSFDSGYFREFSSCFGRNNRFSYIWSNNYYMYSINACLYSVSFRDVEYVDSLVERIFMCFVYQQGVEDARR